MPDAHHLDEHQDDHDLGFSHDLPKMLGRRRLLTLMGGMGLLAVSGLHAAALEYVALPWETAGPYPADGSNSKSGQLVNALTQEGVIREDLRSSFGEFTGSSDGLQLNLEVTLLDANNGAPLAGHAIYIWHCDTTGMYSLYDTPEANYLRGVGVADETGKVRFTTIFPGCYDGRWPHIHFEIFKSVDHAVSGESAVLTAQMALPEKESADVYANDGRYSNGTSNLGRITIASDNVFSDNTEAQIAQQTIALTGGVTSGYKGTMTVPVDLTAERTISQPPGRGGQGGPPPGGFGGNRPEPPPAD